MKTFSALLASLMLHAAQPAVAAECMDLSGTGLKTAGGRLAADFAPASIDRKAALRVTAQKTGADGLVILPFEDFRDGEIRLKVWSELRPDASLDARGFAGLAFRVKADAKAFDYFYVRPDNARAASQLRRNHSLQYAAYPDYPWEVLRKAEPGKYESYADMGLGEWIGIRALVKDGAAQFYVNGAAHPSLVVEDLKLAPGSGAIGLWVGPGTVAHFAEVCVMR
jgi:hypothetical protein